MEVEIYFFHIGLGILLFFIINWIGKHSYSVGYMQISMFLKEETAPAFNFIFRIFAPIIYIIITAVILYKFKLDKYVVNIYLVSVYYIVFRLGFNLITNRGLLLNWVRQFLYWISIVYLSYFAYINLIVPKTNLFPDFSTWANELWIIILIYLFHVFNNIRLSPDKTIKRKKGYLSNRYNFFKNKYGNYINDNVEDKKLIFLVYAVIIYEDFNRPKIVRFVENLSFYITRREHSLGLMQIKTNTFLDDFGSLKLGVEKINKSYSTNLVKHEEQKKQEEELSKRRRSELFDQVGVLLPEYDTPREDPLKNFHVIHGILKDYNPDSNYIHEVYSLYKILIEFFGESK